MTRRCLLLVVAAMLQGCYSYAPLETGVPPAGEELRFDINDRGRFELGDRLGRGVESIEGRLTDATEETYVINVAAVSFLNGERNRWSGESVRLSRSYVDNATVRRLSKRRSWIAAIAVATAITLIVLSTDLFVNFFGDVDNDPPTPEPPSSLIPHPIIP